MSEPPRWESALDEPDDLTGYPTTSATCTYRAHDGSNGPWWFASHPEDPDEPDDPNEGGRFDLPAPHGTCYVASGPVTAVRERLGKTVKHGWVTDSPLWRNTVVSVLDPADRPDPDVPLADTTHGAASDHHSNDLTGPVPYDQTRRWAVAFHAAGLSGIHYKSRMDTAYDAFAEGWFGPGGAPEDPPSFTTLPRDAWEVPLGLRVRPARIDLTTAPIIDT